MRRAPCVPVVRRRAATAWSRGCEAQWPYGDARVLINGRFLPGAPPFETFQRVIGEELAAPAWRDGVRRSRDAL